MNTILENASGQRSTKSKDTPSDFHQTNENNPDNLDQDVDAELIKSSFETFVDKISSYQGAEFPKGKNSNSVNFDPDKFSQAIEAILKYQSDEEDNEEEVSSGSLSDHFFEEDLEDGSDKSDNDEEEEDETIKELMDEMDRQLFNTEVGKSFERSSEDASNQVSSFSSTSMLSDGRQNFRSVKRGEGMMGRGKGVKGDG